MILTHKYLLIIAVMVGLLSYSATAADYAVVVNKDNAATLSQKDISRIFLGKLKAFPDGGQAVPIIQTTGSDISKAFIEGVLKKRSSQYRSYWSKMVFTGKGNPPKEVADDAEAKELVSKNPSIIGIIKASAVDASVKVVLEF